MHIPRSSKLLLALLLNSVVALAATENHGNHDKKHWTGIWATMPQLTEPANLPPAPYVSKIKKKRNRETEWFSPILSIDY